MDLLFDEQSGNHHYVIRYDPSLASSNSNPLQLFVDGEFVAGTVFAPGAGAMAGPLTLGSHPFEDLGNLGEVHVFTTPLSDSDINAIHTYVAGKQYSL